MSQLAATQTSNRRALLAFMAVLAAVVIAAATAMLLLQRQQMLEEEQTEFRNELVLLGELATDALLSSDYATVEGLIQHWLDSHPYVASIKAVMPNGFVLAEASKNIPQPEPVVISQPVVFNGNTLITLDTVCDFSAKNTGFAAIVINTTLVALLLIMLLGWLLWITLKRTALAPLQAQIQRREEKERELLQRTAELEAAISELETFSYSVSHDLRAPLRAIDGFSRVILEDHGSKLDDEMRAHLQRVINGAQRMGELIDDLLELSRVTRRELNLTEVDLSALAQAILDELQAQAPQRRIEIEIRPGIIARGDAQLLQIVMSNLLGNAWKYTGNKPNARIVFKSIKQAGSPPLYCVIDNGAGFDMKYVDKLFKPFQRLHSPEEFAGSGIGLATVARVIQRHGGQIWADSQTGQGARFCFTLARGAEPAFRTPSHDKSGFHQL